MSKYNAKPTIVDGVRFASRKEAARYRELCLMQRAGEIEDLELQPKFPLVVSGINVGTYIADFRYLDRTTGERIVEDVKGVRTSVYKIKAKLVKALHGVEVFET